MGGCNCLRTNAINEELETTNNPKRELSMIVIVKDDNDFSQNFPRKGLCDD